jgi:hypothetical protein
MKRIWLPLSLSSVLWLAAGAVAEVYKWVDEQGVIQYSDRQPASSATPVETMPISPPPPSPAVPEKPELERIRDLARTLAADREAREEARRQARLEAAAVAAQAERQKQETLRQQQADERRERWVDYCPFGCSYPTYPIYPPYPVYPPYPPHPRLPWQAPPHPPGGDPGFNRQWGDAPDANSGKPLPRPGKSQGGSHWAPSR